MGSSVKMLVKPSDTQGIGSGWKAMHDPRDLDNTCNFISPQYCVKDFAIDAAKTHVQNFHRRKR